MIDKTTLIILAMSIVFNIAYIHYRCQIEKGKFAFPYFELLIICILALMTIDGDKAKITKVSKSSYLYVFKDLETSPQDYPEAKCFITIEDKKNKNSKSESLETYYTQEKCASFRREIKSTKSTIEKMNKKINESRIGKT